MKISFYKIVVLTALITLTITSGGCRPSVQDVEKVVASVPLGANRDDIRKVLVAAYGEKFPNWKQSYALIDPPIKVTKLMLKADKDLIANFNKEGFYTEIHPADLYEKMPVVSFTDGVSLASETSDGNGGFSIFYDGKTNYIGYFAYSTKKVH
jgi:hypothetical protein